MQIWVHYIQLVGHSGISGRELLDLSREHAVASQLHYYLRPPLERVLQLSPGRALLGELRCLVLSLE